MPVTYITEYLHFIEIVIDSASHKYQNEDSSPGHQTLEHMLLPSYHDEVNRTIEKYFRIL